MARNFTSEIKSFLGLNQNSLSGSRLKAGESPRMKNLKVTPSYSLTLREGFEKLLESDGEGRGITVFGGAVFFVVGKTLYLFKEGEKRAVGELESESGRVSFLHIGESFFILDGVKIKVWRGDALSDIEPYVPLVVISTDVNGAGVTFEDINLLTPKRRQSFTLDNEHKTLILAEKNIDSVDLVKCQGEVLPVSEYKVNLETGCVELSSNPSTDINAYEVTYSKALSDEHSPHKMRYGVLWGGDNDTRVFLWGDREKPDVYRYSGVHDGMSGMDYFPELSFNKSVSGRPVTSLLRHYDRLLVFTDKEAYYSYIEKRSDASGLEYLSFPVRTLSSEVGCTHENTAVLVDNNPITMSGVSLYRWVSTSVRDERNAVEFGERIRQGLTLLSQELSVFDRRGEGELYLWQKDKIYVYNYRLDLFYYYEGFSPLDFAEDNSNNVYFLTREGALCRLTQTSLDMGKSVDFRWETGYGDSGLDTKNVHSIEFEIIPKSSVAFDVLWASDASSGKGFDVDAEYKVFDFDALFFDRFSFKTAQVPIRLRKRMKLKRVRSFKVIVQNNKQSLDFHLVSLCIKGKITDAK